MNKKPFEKSLTGLAIVGTALGAAFAIYKKIVKKSMTSVRRTSMICGMVKKKSPEVSSCTPCRSYTTIPSDSPVPEDEKHIEESEEDASEKETPSDNSED